MKKTTTSGQVFDTRASRSFIRGLMKQYVGFPRTRLVLAKECRKAMGGCKLY